MASTRDAEEERRGGRGLGGGLEPKSSCTKNGPNEYFLLSISFFTSMKSGSRERGGTPPAPMIVGRSNISLPSTTPPTGPSAEGAGFGQGMHFTHKGRAGSGTPRARPAPLPSPRASGTDGAWRRMNVARCVWRPQEGSLAQGRGDPKCPTCIMTCGCPPSFSTGGWG